ncbi:hypothetical protein HD554DRAFT_2040574 [Boletus coccyginus]|nr:hypothetical protein HD554DRAFT_2040574 [Boletus coccyginus]
MEMKVEAKVSEVKMKKAKPPPHPRPRVLTSKSKEPAGGGSEGDGSYRADSIAPSATTTASAPKSLKETIKACKDKLDVGADLPVITHNLHSSQKSSILTPSLPLSKDQMEEIFGDEVAKTDEKLLSFKHVKSLHTMVDQIIVPVEPVDITVSEDESPWAIQLESIEAKPAIQFLDNMEDIEGGFPVELEVIKSNLVIKFSALKCQLEVQVVPDTHKCKLTLLSSISESEPSLPLGDKEHKH